jgi:4'-phosphopantetheinyl transferase
MNDSVCLQAELRATDFVASGMPLSARDLPGAGEAHLWHLRLGSLSETLRGALGGEVDSGTPELTPAQMTFVRRFYLRLLLGSYLGVAGKDVTIHRGRRGKPAIDRSVHDSSLQFSMAKSGDRLLIGITSEHHMGVDLEPAGRLAHNALGVARRYFSPAEADALSALPDDELQAAFLRTWSLKEAVVKASGMGIANQLCRFTVETDVRRPPDLLEFDGEAAEDWSLALLEPEPGFIGAVAVAVPGVKLQAFQLLPSER